MSRSPLWSPPWGDVLWRVFGGLLGLDCGGEEGLLSNGDVVVGVWILRFLRLREKLRVKVLVIKGVMAEMELRL